MLLAAVGGSSASSCVNKMRQGKHNCSTRFVGFGEMIHEIKNPETNFS
jgi:hypothetical protein